MRPWVFYLLLLLPLSACTIGPQPGRHADTSTPSSPDASFEEAPSYPNPYSPVTDVSFELARSQQVRVVVFDLNGAAVDTLVDGRMPAGDHRIRWDGKNGTDELQPSGVYFTRCVSEDTTIVSKMALIH